MIIIIVVVVWVAWVASCSRKQRIGRCILNVGYIGDIKCEQIWTAIAIDITTKQDEQCSVYQNG